MHRHVAPVHGGPAVESATTNQKKQSEVRTP